jgi:hypothetical protein
MLLLALTVLKRFCREKKTKNKYLNQGAEQIKSMVKVLIIKPIVSCWCFRSKVELLKKDLHYLL